MLRLVALLLFLVNYGLFLASAMEINGWYPCTLTDAAEQSWLNDISFECATVEAALCHPKICTSSKTIELFVKPKLAAATPNQPLNSRKSLWLLAGGPGASSVDQIDGHTDAFSVTSAARDLVYLMEGLAGEEDRSEPFLYGTSYGTFLVERVMRLAPSQVKGYILDGVVSEAGPDPSTRLFFSHWDYNILAPSRRFFELCLQEQETCPLQLDIDQDGDVLDAVLDIYDEIDDTLNDCAVELMLATGVETPSQALRPIFGLLVRDPGLRSLVPSILARMQRCDGDDQQELELVMGPLLKMIVQQVQGAAIPDSKISQAFEKSLRPSLGSRLATIGSNSIDQLEYWLISYSEIWAKPSPTEAELQEFYSDDNDRDPACAQLISASEDVETTNYTQSFIYAPDDFSNQTAPVPPNSSLLVINGGLDFQTPWEFGRYQFEATKLSDPDSSKKMLVEFDFGGHICGLSATTADNETLCSSRVVASFVSNSGDPDAVNTSCMAELPELELNDNTFAMLVESLMEEQRNEMMGGWRYKQ
ncbi:hypothetical protein PHYSODRAFT_306262 [Phytophthora sojae]|uniref:Peptidase S33 tripeptidyl aminopeptidase-like C-terminal domain-containing protein n=1 Tax=Phytophthora sojae (strain P6497) TaxID=1094619 RepID=G5A8N7_PHYSP|nr:hypothetical protein PHYSODRAFT_306262 [Phytophthora sojae]EGZ08263.1 hypothetical protein PHYSODRAFT_306262 [Phytophthora sojae]|eukprot:XP_009536435.1 hypothetical protein PHYSODRAFT_306262 [Phytophthora sojae]